MIQQVLNACSPQGPHQVRTDLPGKINTMRGQTPASQHGCASAGQLGCGGRLEGADSSSTAGEPAGAGLRGAAPRRESGPVVRDPHPQPPHTRGLV